ncbi:helix-turn-helix domain-containing protein [Chryseobacterium sp. Ch-15]|uniref:Helix-turn-helix domain-containing protein n=1 Tax=Chryseobacterium muglaense TaxID=2893752 RepID=A0A9Q3YUA9_9FLAO|nr:helix-turn-helix transcriptional regulator [Chryseobacterium muglaense]MBD3905069.1 helix-turn-helix transcriptional regulator [Chryseobacterium muglaense]MCC9033490.1 helix-turn-helix domain-containing protein [Chryseobacterium muglaense]MCM2555009.1 helix-turn-helix domain-containing protein [Chryseobacterium muglaense]
MNTGTKIKSLREEMHFSQAQLALELGVSQATLHNIESGHSKKVDFLLMNKICQFFEKDFNYFLDGDMINNVRTTQNQIAATNNFEKGYFEEFKNLVIKNKENEEIIEDLKNKLSLKNS